MINFTLVKEWEDRTPCSTKANTIISDKPNYLMVWTNMTKEKKAIMLVAVMVLNLDTHPQSMEDTTNHTWKNSEERKLKEIEIGLDEIGNKFFLTIFRYVKFLLIKLYEFLRKLFGQKNLMK